jgi:DNA (cytosine-5)-methyltransferase 1
VRPLLLDLFCGEGGAGVGYARAGFRVTGVDKAPARLRRYPFDGIAEDAIEYLLNYGERFDAIHASPTCTGYSRGTAAIPDRLDKYDRLIAATREALEIVGKPYVIENVADARRELIEPIVLCGRMFDLTATDDDGTHLVLDRHRLFESNVFLWQPEHPQHDGSQVAGSYGGARRDKDEARNVRKGGYVPSADVQRELLGTPWMTEKGCQLSIPPAYTELIGAQLLTYLGAKHAENLNLTKET